MATVDDVEVANASFPNVRQDLNDILEAITTNFSADTEPTTTYPNQFWYETDTNLLYIRNEADDAWITLASINQTTGEWEPRTAVIQAIDSAGIALKTDDGTTRFSISDAGVVSFENYSFPSADGTDGQVLTTDGAGNLTFESGGGGDKIEEGNSSVEVVDTGTGHVAVTVDGSETARFDANGRLGIGTTSPSSPLHVEANFNTEYGVRFKSTAGTDHEFGFKTLGTNAGTLELYSITNSDSKLVSFDNGGNFGFNSGYGSVATAYGCRAWVNFRGTATVVVRESGNVSSVSDDGSGIYTINFTTSLVDTTYAIVGSTRYGSSNNQHLFTIGNNDSTGDYTTSAVRVRTVYSNGDNVAQDCSLVSAAIFR